MMLKNLKIRKFLYFTAAFLIIVFAHSYTVGNCLDCLDTDSRGNCDCCCKTEQESRNNCCSVPETQTSHNCIFCDSDDSFVQEDKLFVPNQKDFQHLIPVEPVKVLSDDLIKPVKTFLFEKSPELTYSLLSFITVLRI